MLINRIKSGTWVAVLAMAIVILFIACDAGGGASGSDPQITGVSLGEGITISTAIDSDSRSITIEAPPVDLSKLSPVFQVSGGSVENAPTLADGQTVKVPVVSDNGDTVDWNVTVNLAYGMSFKFGGKWVFALYGLKKHIDGRPAASRLGNDGNGAMQVYCFPEIQGNSYRTKPHGFLSLWEFDGAGSYDTEAGFTYIDASSTSYVYTKAASGKQDNTVTVLTECKNVGDDLVAAFTFLSENQDNSTGGLDVTQGFVKAQRIANNVYSNS